MLAQFLHPLERKAKGWLYPYMVDETEGKRDDLPLTSPFVMGSNPIPEGRALMTQSSPKTTLFNSPVLEIECHCEFWKG